MALGPRRKVDYANLTEFFAMNMVGERGGIVCASSTAGEVEYFASPTGATRLPVGILLDDVESLNFDRHPEYLQRNVVDVGSQVSIASRGEFQTNLVVGTPTQGQTAYLHQSGYISATQLSDGIISAPAVGKFRTGPDANGFVHVLVTL
jgi:hypothetical protein